MPMPTQAPTQALRVNVNASAISSAGSTSAAQARWCFANITARDRRARDQHQQPRVGHVEPERPLRPPARDCRSSGSGTGRCPSVALTAPTVMIDVDRQQRPPPAEQPVGERDDDQEDQLLGVDQADARVDREDRRDERRDARRPRAARTSAAPRRARGCARAAPTHSSAAIVSRMSAAAIDTCSAAANASSARHAARSSGAGGSAGIASNQPFVPGVRPRLLIVPSIAQRLFRRHDHLGRCQRASGTGNRPGAQTR